MREFDRSRKDVKVYIWPDVKVECFLSGDPAPSTEDSEITNRLKAAGKIIGIEVLDHIVIARKGFYSFLEEGRL